MNNTKYLSATCDEFLQANGARENTAQLGSRVIPNATVGIWRPNIRLWNQHIKNVKIWKCGKGKNCIDKDVILLGYAESFFGHFLADSMSRAWIAIDDKYKNAEFIVVRAPNMKQWMEDLAREMYALAGIKNLTFVRDRTRFKSVTIPDSSFDYTRLLFHKKYTDTFKKIADNATKGIKAIGPKKIYMSRTQLNENPTLGEDMLEKIFIANGYTVVHIQKLSITEQIAVARNATHIAGLEGTALHQTLFARDGINLICINRYNAAIPMQILIDKLKGINATYVDASIDPYSRRKNESPLTIIGLNKNLRRFLDGNGFKYDADAMRAADARNMKIFMEIWRAHHRWLPKWLAQIITVLIPVRKWRKAARRRLGVSFQGITREEVFPHC